MKMAARKPAMSVTMPPPKRDHEAGSIGSQAHHFFGRGFERRQTLVFFAAG